LNLFAAIKFNKIFLSQQPQWDADMAVVPANFMKYVTIKASRQMCRNYLSLGGQQNPKTVNYLKYMHTDFNYFFQIHNKSAESDAIPKK